MFCTKCGNQIPDGSAVCPICGAPLAAPQAAPQPQVAPQAAPQQFAAAPVAPAAPKAKKAGNNKLPLIIGAVAAVAVIAVVLILLLSGGPKSVVKKYLKAQEANEEAIADLTVTTSKKAREALELDKKDKDDDDDEINWKVTDSKTYSGKDDAFKGLKNYVSKSMNGNEDKVSKMAIVEVKTWSGSDKDKATYLYFTCVKVKGNWYILKYETGGKDTKIKTVANAWADKADKKSSDD